MNAITGNGIDQTHKDSHIIDMDLGKNQLDLEVLNIQGMDNLFQNSNLTEQGKPQIESIEFLDTKLWNHLLKSLNDTKSFKAEVAHNRVLIQDWSSGQDAFRDLGNSLIGGIDDRKGKEESSQKFLDPNFNTGHIHEKEKLSVYESRHPMVLHELD